MVQAGRWTPAPKETQMANAIKTHSSIATDSEAELRRVLGEDATSTFEDDPKFINSNPAAAGSSQNVAVQRDEDDTEDSDEEEDEEDEDGDEEDEDEDEDEDDLETDRVAEAALRMKAEYAVCV